MQVLEGLYSKDLSMYLLVRDHRNEDDFLGDMVKYECLDISRAMRSASHQYILKTMVYISLQYDS
jgi:hypothetical protein